MMKYPKEYLEEIKSRFTELILKLLNQAIEATKNWNPNLNLGDNLNRSSNNPKKNIAEPVTSIIFPYELIFSNENWSKFPVNKIDKRPQKKPTNIGTPPSLTIALVWSFLLSGTSFMLCLSPNPFIIGTKI